jgi:hypothetical protein
MPGNISQFLADINKRGIAKSSHFDVKFWINVALVSSIPDLTSRCESAELPGRQIATTDNKIYGPIYKTPYQTIYAEMTMTFIDTADMSIRLFFEEWMNSIYNPKYNQMQYLDTFMADAEVTQYDLDGDTDSLNKTLQFKLLNIFPTNINQMSTSWGDDSPHKLSVTFFYERYEIQIDKTGNKKTTIEMLPTPDYMVEYPEDEKNNDNQINSQEIARSIMQQDMVEYPEDEKINDEQINADAYAQSQIRQNARPADLGLFGNVIKDIANKVKGL